MGRTLKTLALAGLFAISSGLVFGTSPARAQGYYNNGGYSNGGYVGGGYAVPTYRYYGNGGHDAAPHWHTTQTPIGNFSYYGNGRHDFRPHGHDQTPYGITSYSGGLFRRTQSYAPPTPYGYRPW